MKFQIPLWTVLFVISLALPSFGKEPVKPKGKEKDQSRLYYSKKLGFGLTLPPGWKALDSKKDIEELGKTLSQIPGNKDYSRQIKSSTSVLFMGPMKDLSPPTMIAMTQKDVFPITKESKKEFLKGVRQAQKKPAVAMRKPKIISCKIIEIKGVKCIELRSHHTYLNQKFYQWDVIIPGGKKMFFLKFEFDYDKAESHREDVEKMLQSFRGAKPISNDPLEGKSEAYKLGYRIGYWGVIFGVIVAVLYVLMRDNSSK